MTEAEWLGCGKPIPMLRFLRGRVSDRKMRLFGAACYRTLWTRLPVDAIRREVLAASEAYADGAIGKPAFKLTQKRIPGWDGPVVRGEAWEVAEGSSRRCSGERWPAGSTEAAWDRPEELPAQCQLLRDIVGNPFRPVAVNPSWLTSTVVALARGMYDTRDFTAMPILADALQDAGCDNADVLDHCRGPGPHVRGCWVVDQVLRKS